MGKFDYLVHRCPKCNSKSVAKLAPKEKSTLHKGLEMVGGFAEGYFLGTNGGITEYLSKQVYDPDKQNKFYCEECHHAWKVANMVDETPIEVLEQEKKEKIKSIRSGAFSLVLFSLIGVAVTGWLFHYLWVNDFRYYEEVEKWWGSGTVQVTHYHWSWLFMGILFIGALSLTLFWISSAKESFEDLSHLKKLSASSFRKSKLR